MEIRLKNIDLILNKLKEQQDKFSPKSASLRASLIRVANLVINEAKLNIRKERLIDTGRLWNSLRYEFYKPDNDTHGVRIGSFGVPYAALWEFGYHGPVAVRSHNRLMTTAFGRPIAPTIVRVSNHIRNVNIDKRPYLLPAFEQHKKRIVEIISKTEV